MCNNLSNFNVVHKDFARLGDKRNHSLGDKRNHSSLLHPARIKCSSLTTLPINEQVSWQFFTVNFTVVSRGSRYFEETLKSYFSYSRNTIILVERGPENCAVINKEVINKAIF